jgi:hypothetical protein|tara:strand:- start:90 stop:320 length:231 start_codon:yes stop_codon:yes gene_type:complete
VVDNLIVIHNVDEKSTNFYDIKLAEYAQPICVDNLDIDTTYASEHYHSDLIFPEEKQANDVNQGNDTMIENDTSNG